ncbi:hypothetical protein [Tengunoibacter tsumagoiensis]|uniref:Uncharacterized protein n=1 Tax=Tengunoibacter tsumagoiensis TaxID=2014871 RepID=A0A402A558_9CHLR|nr:hypothetical protein [Tengunoibacter tsumagoiensis]GCE14141.1 hypothetical protein KTT_40000 [Tengunoibacter tsumagoiensis]
MGQFNVFQKNNLITGTHLAVEITSSFPNHRAFVVIGSYEKTLKGHARPSSILNRDYSDLRFWFRQYEVDEKFIGSNEDISVEQLANHVFKKDIDSLEHLENELEVYLQDFSLLKPVWRFDPKLPFN